MSASTPHTLLPGSEPPEHPEDRPTPQLLDLERPHQVAIALSPPRRQEIEALIAEHSGRLPKERRRLAGHELEALFAADPADLARVGDFARAAGLRVVESDLRYRQVVLGGSLRRLAQAFGVEPYHVRRRGRTHLTHRGPIHLPSDLVPCVEAVHGLDRRPRVHPLLVGQLLALHEVEPAPLDPRRLVTAYDFPPAADGSGECVAIIVLGGGIHRGDLEAYFRLLDLPVPKVTMVSIQGVANDPADPAAIQSVFERAGIASLPVRDWSDDEGHPTDAAKNSAGNVKWTIEATLDVELVGALAPGAEILMVFAPDDMGGKQEAFRRILSDPRRPGVVSCSWGGFETNFSPQDKQLTESLLERAAAAHVTVCFASGDFGDGTKAFAGPGDAPVVFYPSGSPLTLACGGTMAGASGGSASTWNELWGPQRRFHSGSGGGVAEWIAPLAWQRNAAVEARTGNNGRGIPDVAALAQMEQGFHIVCGGAGVSVGGTSAATAVWAALVARLNQGLRGGAAAGEGPRAGYLTPLLYRPELSATFTDVTAGDNGAYRAATGWDACTGWGTPNGLALLRALQGT